MEFSRLQSTLIALLCLNGLALIPHSLAQSNPEDYINAHNAAREEVGVGPMSWDDKLATYAQNYANKKVDGCSLDHSMGPYGENLAIGGAGTDAINMWVSEKADFDFSSKSCKKQDECLHFTQVIWRDSVRLGCGRAKCKGNNEAYFVICSYDPPGNYDGQSPY